METLKKLFPFSFKKMESVADLIVGIIVYVVAAIIAGLVITVATFIGGWIPVVGAILGFVLGAVGTLVEVYVIAGIVIKILVYTKVIKE